MSNVPNDICLVQLSLGRINYRDFWWTDNVLSLKKRRYRDIKRVHVKYFGPWSLLILRALFILYDGANSFGPSIAGGFYVKPKNKDTGSLLTLFTGVMPEAITWLQKATQFIFFFKSILLYALTFFVTGPGDRSSHNKPDFKHANGDTQKLNDFSNNSKPI